MLDPCVNNLEQTPIKLSCFSLMNMSDNSTTNVGYDKLKDMENDAADAFTNNDITPSADAVSLFLREIRNYVST